MDDKIIIGRKFVFRYIDGELWRGVLLEDGDVVTWNDSSEWEYRMCFYTIEEFKSDIEDNIIKIIE
jgi:hypothetical protein